MHLFHQTLRTRRALPAILTSDPQPAFQGPELPVLAWERGQPAPTCRGLARRGTGILPVFSCARCPPLLALARLRPSA